MRPPSGGSDSDNDDGGDDGDHDDDHDDGVEAEEMKKSGTGMRGSSLLQTESLSVLNLPPYRLAALSQVSPCSSSASFLSLIAGVARELQQLHQRHQPPVQG